MEEEYKLQTDIAIGICMNKIERLEEKAEESKNQIAFLISFLERFCSDNRNIKNLYEHEYQFLCENVPLNNSIDFIEGVMNRWKD